MPPRTICLATPLQRQLAHSAIDAAPDGALLKITDKGETRTAAQNRTLHMWFGQIAKHQGDVDADDIKGMCHRRWGLTIRLRDAQFAWMWERTGAALPYEKQCKMLASGILGVSSAMTAEELSEYLDGMARHFRSEGVRLTDPDARRYEEAAA